MFRGCPNNFSLSEGWRIVVSEDGDDYYKYGIVDPDGMSVKEIKDALFIPYNGKPASWFTVYIHVHALPDGNMSVIHRVGRDV